MTKESKVKEIKKIRPWTGERGTVYYFTLEMENGDKGEIGKQTEQSLKVGSLLKYTIETGKKGQSVFKEVREGKGWAQASKPAQSNAVTALQCAEDLAAAYVSKCDVPIEKMDALADRILATADKFKKWLDCNN